MRRGFALAILGTLVALVWAPSLVSGASPTPALASSAALPQDPSASPSASADSAMLATPGPSGVVNAPGATPSSSPVPAAPAGATASPSPAASSVAAPAAPTASGSASANPAPGTSATTSGDGPAPSATVRAAPRASQQLLAGAPQRVPQASPSPVASAQAITGRDGIPSSLSRTMLMAIVAVAGLALLAMSFVLLSAHHTEVRTDATGAARDPTLSAEERSALATQATLARRAVRRARLRASNDPILRAMGYGSDDDDPPVAGAGKRPDDDRPGPRGRGRSGRSDR